MPEPQPKPATALVFAPPYIALAVALTALSLQSPYRPRATDVGPYDYGSIWTVSSRVSGATTLSAMAILFLASLLGVAAFAHRSRHAAVPVPVILAGLLFAALLPAHPGIVSDDPPLTTPGRYLVAVACASIAVAAVHIAVLKRSPRPTRSSP